MGKIKIEIDLNDVLHDIHHLDGFCRGYFKKQNHDYHKSLKEVMLLIRNMQKDLKKDE